MACSERVNGNSTSHAGSLNVCMIVLFTEYWGEIGNIGLIYNNNKRCFDQVTASVTKLLSTCYQENLIQCNLTHTERSYAKFILKCHYGSLT